MAGFKGFLLAACMATVAASGVMAQEVLKLGMSVPLSGAAATWGKGMEYAGKFAAQQINDTGGVKVGGKTYKFEIVAYDNKYNAAEGAKVAQMLLNRDNVRYVVGSIGTAPVAAMQALSERKEVLLFTSSWGKSTKGPKFPLTLSVLNTPYEILPQFYAFIKQQHPNVKTVAMLNPNDASGKETEPLQRQFWEAVGVKVVSSDWYERGTTEFQPIAAKMAAQKSDVVDFGVTPSTDAGVVFRELKTMSWNGIKVVPVGTGAEVLVKVGGDSVEDAYMGLAADYDGPGATEVQRKLSKGLHEVIGEPLNSLSLNGYDAVMALKAGMETAKSIDPKEIVPVLHKIIFDSSFGRSCFGGADYYGSPQHFLVPVIVTQIKSGKAVELKRIAPPELSKRLAAAK